MFFRRGPTFETEQIVLKLARGWKRVGNDDPTLAEFDHASEGKHLSASVFNINDPIGTSVELRQAVEDVYNVRVAAERDHVAADDPIVANGVTEAAGRFLGFFCGYQQATRRLFGGYLYGKGRVIVTLYLEGMGTDQKQHMDCLVAILNQVQFKDEA